jgi:cyclopropane fatty-acyl-phospholipid synthase-like methyltransferase
MTILTYAIISVLALVIAYYLGIFTGAHYVPTTDKTVERMIRMAKLVPGEKLTDIGSGDGKILIAAAKLGVESVGYEINPLLVLWSRARIARAGLKGKAKVYWKSFWNVDLSEFSVVTVYGIPHIMATLEKKVSKELAHGSRVVCNSFPLPNKSGAWVLSEKEYTTYCFLKNIRNTTINE